MSYRITTEKQLRAEFWATFRNVRRRYTLTAKGIVLAPQNQQPADTRCAFVDWIDSLQKGGEISSELAGRATL